MEQRHSIKARIQQTSSIQTAIVAKKRFKLQKRFQAFQHQKRSRILTQTKRQHKNNELKGKHPRITQPFRVPEKIRLSHLENKREQQQSRSIPQRLHSHQKKQRMICNNYIF